MYTMINRLNITHKYIGRLCTVIVYILYMDYYIAIISGENMAKKDDDVTISDKQLALVKSLYEYNPDKQWVANYLGISETELNVDYGVYISLLNSDKNRTVEYCLYHLATVNKDIRAILAWLEVYMPEKYGKGSEMDVQELKMDILKHLASKLPG